MHWNLHASWCEVCYKLRIIAQASGFSRERQPMAPMAEVCSRPPPAIATEVRSSHGKPGFSERTMDTPKLLHTSAMVRALSPLHCDWRLLLTPKLPDPREYCISTKDFVLDDEGKLQGLNTGGQFFFLFPSYWQLIVFIRPLVQYALSGRRTAVDAGRWRKYPALRSFSLHNSSSLHSVSWALSPMSSRHLV